MIVLDTEVYRNYFLARFTQHTGKQWVFEKHDGVILRNTIREMPKTELFITFNGIGYDLLILGAANKGDFKTEYLKEISDTIILSDMPYWEVQRKFDITIPKWNHIDISNVLFGMVSLKLYGGRIHAPTLQDLPIPPDQDIQAEQLPLMNTYCENDCTLTKLLYDAIEPQIKLREKLGAMYELDLRSKSDAQIAEAVIASEYMNITGNGLMKPENPPTQFKYVKAPFVSFEGEYLNTMLGEIEDAVFTTKESGHVDKNPALDRKFEFNNVMYQMGMGGLHTVDAPGSFYANEDVAIFDIDVASYYPAIILNADYAPSHMGETFTSIYRKLVDKRLTAKRSGDKVMADTLKIVVNGTFGKLGSKYSKVYAPDLMANVTITGQLCLLKLIEQLNCPVLSANTDGIMVMVRRSQLDDLRAIVSEWESQTGFDMEWTAYRSIHRRDVNNYVAFTEDGKHKTKGVFVNGGMAKNPSFAIIYTAVINYFRDSTPIETTIRDCTDIKQFISVRTVKGGAVYNGELVGKVVRWYRSMLSASTINYMTSGNKVPLSDDAVVVQVLPDSFPVDIDYAWYISQANVLKNQMEAG